MKFSYTKNTESVFFINKPNLTKKFWRLGGEVRGWGVARVSDFFLFFPKESKSEKKKKQLFSF